MPYTSNTSLNPLLDLVPIPKGNNYIYRKTTI